MEKPWFKKMQMSKTKEDEKIAESLFKNKLRSVNTLDM